MRGHQARAASPDGDPGWRWTVAVAGRLLVAVCLCSPAAARADDALLGWVSHICHSVGSGGEAGLVSARMTLAAYEATLAGDVNKIRQLDDEHRRLRAAQVQLAATLAQMGGTVDAGIRIIQRDAEARKQGWRDQIQPQLDALRAEQAPIDAQMAALNAERAQAEQELKREQSWLSWIFRSEKAATLKARIAELDRRIGEHGAARAAKAGALTARQAELDGLVASEEQQAKAREASHRALWDSTARRQQDYERANTQLRGQIEVLRAPIGKRQFAIQEARLCIAAASGRGGRTAASPAPDPPDPTSTGDASGGGGRDSRQLGGGGSRQPDAYTKPADANAPAPRSDQTTAYPLPLGPGPVGAPTPGRIGPGTLRPPMPRDPGRSGGGTPPPPAAAVPAGPGGGSGCGPLGPVCHCANGAKGHIPCDEEKKRQTPCHC